MKKYLITGIIVWVPIAAIIFLVRFFLDIFNNIANLVPAQYQPESLFGFHIPGFSLLFILMILIITGFVAKNWLGKTLIEFSEKIVERIPLIRSVYKGIKQSLTVILSSKSTSFREVVMLQYPRQGVWSIGFKTSNMKQEQQNTGQDLIMVFVPTTPNPTSGFLVMVPETEITKLNLKVDEALKLIISLGTSQISEHDGVEL